MNEKIFKAYDIRGVYEKDFDQEDVRKISKAYLQTLANLTVKPVSQLKIVIARDIRNSSEKIHQIFIEEVLKYGVQIDDLDLISIDALYYIVGADQYDGGIMVTASHNPPEYGGLKMLSAGSEIIRGTELKEVVSNLEEFKLAPGKLNKLDIWSRYLDHVFSFVDLDKIKNLKLVADAGSGMAAINLPKILDRLSQIDFVGLFMEPDGNFPHRNPNPLAPNASDQLAAKVLATQADLGAIFDADSDRILLVDEKGNLIKGDQILLLLSKAVLAKKPGSAIVYNLICSHAVPELITAWGGVAVRSEVGFVNIKKHARENNAVMGGEVSAHFSFKDNYFSDSAFIALLLILEILSSTDQKLSELVKENTLYFKGDEVNLEVKDVQAELQKIREKYQGQIKDEIDGITVEFSDRWFNVRASNTEPLLRVTVEGNTAEILAAQTKELLELINN
ncbi:phosphomannomutase/phosphoglucomutase [Candidatus Nomurabacteria bacterium]|nr:phosphomannomutase/phosphoglucomutase [Candidatus Nomurabacteria bacterium]